LFDHDRCLFARIQVRFSLIGWYASTPRGKKSSLKSAHYLRALEFQNFEEVTCASLKRRADQRADQTIDFGLSS
jgi:hypothetical protein